jgi:Tol biopolymer transport system component
LREFALSPDGRFVATTANDSDPGDIWIQDLERSTKTRLTFDAGSQSRPAWSANGREILYSVNTGGIGSKRPLMRKSADGAGQAAVLFEVAGIACSDWSRDGRYVAYQFQEPERTIDIGYVDLEKQGQPEPTPFLSTPFDDKYPKLSPDVRFVAYVSNESGRFEVYVQSFPSGAGRWQASVNGGEQPRWRADGKELYYVETDALMAVSVSEGPGGLAFGRPQRLFQTADLLSQFGWPEYDVSPDGQSLLTAAPVEEKDQAPPAIRLVENWYEELRNRERE